MRLSFAVAFALISSCVVAEEELPQGLVGEWRAERITDMAADQPAPTMILAADRSANGNAGCNGWGTAVLLGGPGAMRFANITTTSKSCSETRGQEQERRFLDAVDAVAGWSLVDDRLSLRNADGAEVLVLERTAAEPRDEVPPKLLGKWQAEAIGGEPADKAVSTLSFGPDAHVDVEYGCNGGGGLVVVDGEALAFGSVFSTLMYCGEDAEMDQEDAFGAALGDVQAWAVVAERLVLSDGKGTELAVLTRMAR